MGCFVEECQRMPKYLCKRLTSITGILSVMKKLLDYQH